MDKYRFMFQTFNLKGSTEEIKHFPHPMSNRYSYRCHHKVWKYELSNTAKQFIQRASRIETKPIEYWEELRFCRFWKVIGFEISTSLARDSHHREKWRKCNTDISHTYSYPTNHGFPKAWYRNRKTRNGWIKA